MTAHKRLGPEWSNQMKDKLLKTQNNKCNICYEENNLFFLDHKTPLKLGGSNEIENLQLLCSGCNKQKTKNDVKDIWNFMKDNKVEIKKIQYSTKCPLCNKEIKGYSESAAEYNLKVHRFKHERDDEIKALPPIERYKIIRHCDPPQKE